MATQLVGNRGRPEFKKLDHPTVTVGSEAQLWGSHVAIDEVANRAGTIGYELMSKITNRVPRVINDGER